MCRRFISVRPGNVTARTSVKREDIETKVLKYRNKKKINYDLLTEDISNIIVEGEDLDELIKRFEDSLRSILDKHAPEKTKRITLRKKKPWYSEELKEQKCKVQRLEKKWKQYKLHSIWEAIKVEQTKYKHLLLKRKLPKLVIQY